MVTPIDSEIKYAELPIEDINWYAVPLSDVINAGKRLEATVFASEHRHALDTIKRSVYPVKTLVGNKNSFATAYRPGICKRIFVDDKIGGIPMLTPSQITEIKPQAEKFLSCKMKSRIADWFVKKGEILLTCSGTVGKVTLVTRTLEGTCVSQNLIRITAHGHDIGFLYAFLRTQTGQALLTGNNYGAVIQHIDPGHLTGIPIPNPPDVLKKKINDLVMRSFDLRDESNELLEKASSLLVNELKLPPIDQFDASTNTNTYNVKLSNFAGRLDSSYHLPVANAIVKHLQKHSYEVTTIGDSRVSERIILPGRFKRVYVTEGRGRVFFGGKQIHELDPFNKKYLSLVHHGHRIRSQLELSENMTLITSSGTIGKVTLVPRHWERWTANQHIIRIIPANEEIAGYLSVFLATDYGHALITRFTYGSVVDEIDDNHVSQIAFPLLNDPQIQSEINSLAIEANKLRHQAYLCEQEATKVLNEEVLFHDK